MDVFLTHVTVIDGTEILHKYTCVELKTGHCTLADIRQIVKYEHWLVRKLGQGDAEMVQSMVIAHDFQKEAVEYVRKRISLEERTVRLVQYKLAIEPGDLVLQELDLS